MKDRRNTHTGVTFKENEKSGQAGEGVKAASPDRKGPHPRRRLWGLPFKVTLLLLCSGILLISLGSVFSLLKYQSYTALYHTDLALAQGGEQHLKNAAAILQTLAKNPLNAAPVLQAQREFSAAASAFSNVNSGLTAIPAIGTLLPVYGSRLKAALHVVPLAVEMSQAGVLACNILQVILARYHDPLNTHSSGLTSADFTGIDRNFSQIQGLVEQAIGQANALQANDIQFDPRIGKVMDLFHKYLPTAEIWLQNADALLAIAPTLLGVSTPAHYLIEMLDSTELRPTGGFIGNFGIATLVGGKLTQTHITDVYLFDWPFQAAGHRIAYPPSYNWFSTLTPNGWSFRDSNLEPDFPASAQMGELNYQREGGNTPLQGVISITPALIQHLLEVTGPIAMPEYHEMVTAQNLIALIHYHQLGAGRVGNDVPSPDGHSSVRKHFTELLSEHFMARVHQLSSSTLSGFVQVMLNGLRSKDIEVYFNARAAESALQQLHMAATVDAPANDSLFVVDTNFSPDKANNLITNTMNDQVTIDANGNALHQTTLRYYWGTYGDVYGALTYRDYIRVYMPPGSVVTQQQGWQPGGTSMIYGREMIAGLFTFQYSQTFVLHLTWMVPHAATKDAQGWHYHYEMQRQAGTHWILNLAIHLPTCATSSSSTGGLTPAAYKTVVALNKPVNEDLFFGIDYRC